MTDSEKESWGSFMIESPLKLDFDEIDSFCLAETQPLYELYVERQGTPLEFVRFKYLWNDFSEYFNTVTSTIKSKFSFDELTGTIHIDFAYSEYKTFKEIFMTLDDGLTLKVVARLPGSASDGASVNFMNLQSVDFRVEFVEPEAANECLNSRLVLQGTEVMGGVARDTNITEELQIAAIGSDIVTSLEIRWLKARTNKDNCKRHSVIEYWDKYACDEVDSTMMEDGTMMDSTMMMDGTMMDPTMMMDGTMMDSTMMMDEHMPMCKGAWV
jgi:hypothetical protein